MSKMSDKILTYMAYTAEEAFREAMGLASRGGSYEPKMPEVTKQYKSEHVSKIVKLFGKLAK